jgi:1,5-anhydro-D-fructose reductase (1,5-anhydro-D-mannitol-forming)
LAVRWGVIGAGGFADRRSIPGLKEAENAVLQAVMVRDLNRAKALAEKHGAQEYYDSVEGLLSSESIDAVHISTPVYLHCEHTVAAARRGKHVLCEKPMARTVEECREMIEACRAKGVKLAIGYMMRFRAHHRKAKELINDGTLGQIAEARAQNHLWYPDVPGAWRQAPELGGGGSLADVGSHCIDLLRFLLGEVAEVTAMMDTIVFSYPVEDTALMMLKFEGGAQGIVDASFAVPHRQCLLEVYGTKGTLLALRALGPFTDPEMRLYSEEGVEEIHVPWVNAYTAEFEDFGRCIEEGGEPAVTGQDGLRITRIMAAAYESAKMGATVKVS